MAKITITLEDKPGGKVECKATPSFETMAKMANSGETMTAAHGYALAAINVIAKVSKNQGNIPMLIPRVRGGM